MVSARGDAPLTNGIVIVTTAAWVLAIAAVQQSWLAEQGGFIPLRLSGQVGGFMIPVILTPFTATVIHGGFFHILTNMLMLIICGRAVEQVLGSVALAILYGVGAIAAAGAQYLVNPGSPIPMIGASGAISAVLSVYAMLFSRNEIRAMGPIPAHWVRALWLAAGWIGIQLLIGMATRGSEYQIATAAHVGGFLAGLALARPLLAWRYRRA